MRRLGLLFLCLVLICGFASTGICETEYPSVFESKLYYRGELNDSIVSDDFVPGGAWHVDCPEGSTQSYDSLQWAGIPFSLEERAPVMNDWIWGPYNKSAAWPLYFNEMYYLGGKGIQTDENGYSPFWDKLSFHGESIDPYTAPPNYDPDMDYWREVRDLIGYAWYWYYFAYESNEYIKYSDRVWNWNGIEFEPEFPPPTYTDDDYDNDPWMYVHITRGYLDLWEEYFNDLYYQSLSE